MWRDKDGVSLRESARRRRGLPDGGEWGEGRSLGTGGREGGILCEQSESTCCLHLGTHLTVCAIKVQGERARAVDVGGWQGWLQVNIPQQNTYIHPSAYPQ